MESDDAIARRIPQKQTFVPNITERGIFGAVQNLKRKVTVK